ncbi:hypothetical protein M9H77_36498 [Catharanthus roseus]|uniref:Uncharacterized protein n=1 Tax=Catharanthus roseus TaxID=4058 RepID=A0ACB9ZSC6_CATRO|nr:hypothetical protein M9H77_36498 [Catharanthus roseus]
MGMHRNPQHLVDFIEWAPGLVQFLTKTQMSYLTCELNIMTSGAHYCALVGDFNGWSPTEICTREDYFAHDDYEPDNLYFQHYNYVDDYDEGNSGVTIEEIFQKANDEYWEPGEDWYKKSRYEVAAKLYEQIFGPNGPQTEDELEDNLIQRLRYKA